MILRKPGACVPSDAPARIIQTSTTENGPIRVPVHRLSDKLPPTPPKLPSFPIEIEPPDLSPWRTGNTGLPGVHQFRSPAPGPHVALTALMHGNEYAGAIVLADLLRSAFTPKRGTLSLIFLNLDAFDRFSSTCPTASRFIDEDMNRLWCRNLLTTGTPSAERSRVAALLPYIETVDTLLDLHSMLWPAAPMFLAGPGPGGLALATKTGTPPLVVSDCGHATGPRLIDNPHFTSPATHARACLLEAGQHWTRSTLAVTRETTTRFLALTRLTDTIPGPLPEPRQATVTDRVVAHTASFTFLHTVQSGQIIPERGTVIARDGSDEIRTPYDNCLLVIPNFRTARGHTAVRLARLLPPSAT
ncbi:M14 family metallopeptidase [Acetobacter fallax]|uniref:Peptidase M14 n=1 Tax=Acetobacter fallax TaxID=1737473 RepID=A0ABX0K6M8_9PROT|nr:succinylglutamate desuccinylase/aspartoacylase family protein [Acetobacter fallax]NHO31407.1 peptidase M14 [Acetobacter fallax]NHO35011.1 peptidase M14 [Acetobacter fallax]